VNDEPIGRARGGYARANKLTPEQRREIARQGGKARHGVSDDGMPVLEATHGSPDHPLRIGKTEIPCYVLENGTRVLSQRGLQTGIGMSIGGSSRAGEQRMAVFVDRISQKGLDTRDLAARIRNPIRFRLPNGGPVAFGYEATILADICDAVLAAREKGGVLYPQQAHIAKQCEILVRGFARVGIIALVDEATGYQDDRVKDALASILEAFIAKELQAWVQTFPADFYSELFRLRGLKYPNSPVKRPQYFGILTNDIVYKRIAPGVLDELKKVTPRNSSGRLKHKLFQRLTSNVGYPKLREHLGSVVSIMKLSEDWPDFTRKLDRLHPRYGETIPLPLEYQKDDGKGL
jgi:hypothetical protein